MWRNWGRYCRYLGECKGKRWTLRLEADELYCEIYVVEKGKP